MELKKCRVAVVGCGMISDIYMQNIKEQFAVLELVACSDLDAARMNAMAEKYGIKPMAYDAILADPDIDMVLNLTNPGAHYPLTKAALQAKKHVWSEKMIAVELEHGRELVQLAKENGVRLGVAPDTFLGSAVQTARYVLDSGLIGKPLSYVATLSRDYSVYSEVLPHLRKRGGSLLFDMGGYYLTALGSLFGPVREAAAFTVTNQPTRQYVRVDNDLKNFGQNYEIEVSNVVSASLRYDNGVLGCLHLNSDCIHTPDTAITVYGTEGIMYMDDPNEFGGTVRVKKVSVGGAQTFEFPATHGYSENSRGLGAAEMAWSIVRGRKNRASKEMAYHIFETMHRIMQSAETGSVCQVESTFEIPAGLPTDYIGDGVLTRKEESALSI